MSKPIMQLYKEWLKNGHFTYDGTRTPNGLCNALKGKYLNTLSLFEPDEEERAELSAQNYNYVYWGSGKGVGRGDTAIEVLYGFTELRQTIVLLIAAMHDELD